MAYFNPRAAAVSLIDSPWITTRQKTSQRTGLSVPPDFLLDLPSLLEQSEPLDRDLVVSRLAGCPALVDQIIVVEREKRTIAALAMEIDGAVATQPSEPGAGRNRPGSY